MLGVVELLDVQVVVRELDYCPFIIVDVTVIGGGENRDDDWKFSCAVPPMHFVAV